MLPQSTIEQAEPIIPLINVGACLDIPTGVFVKGYRGENILLGGMGPLTGMTGPGNSYKSTIMHFMTLSAADRMASTASTHIETFDTEMNIDESRLMKFAQQFQSFKGHDVMNNGTWNVTNSTKYYGNKWHEAMKTYCNAKKEMGDKIKCVTPFMDRNKQPLKIILPTFAQVDSFSRFETEDVGKIQEDVELGDSAGNTIHMRQGLSKLRFLMDAPVICVSSNNFMMLSAHQGQEHAMASGPYAPKPQKKIPHMKPGEKIKGVTDAFFYLTTAFFQTVSCGGHTVKAADGSANKPPMYPRDKYDVADKDGLVDLNQVGMKILRSKFGPSGTVITISVSQTDGVLPTLTEFCNLKDSDSFGLEGSDRNYSLVIYPERKLSRTTVRGSTETDMKLCRAMNITSEICQMRQFYRSLNPDLLDMKKIYEGVRDRGYDWNFILEHTRGWWTVKNDDHPTLWFLSSKDIVEMSVGAYHPYWMEDDKKSIKKEFKKQLVAI